MHKLLRPRGATLVAQRGGSPPIVPRMPPVRGVANLDLGQSRRQTGRWGSKGFGHPGYPKKPDRMFGLDLNLQVREGRLLKIIEDLSQSC